MPVAPLSPAPFGAARRVLFVHAHPDDETIATGALIAALTAAGLHCAVLTATRGERGEVRPGVLPPGGDLTALRLAEWSDACAALGVTANLLLGTPPARAPGRPPRRYEDSGMAWLDASETLAGPAPDAPADALTAADQAEVAADIAAAAAHLGADLLVTYDELGGYGHPDHVFLHAPTRAAADALGLPMVELVSQPRSAATADCDAPPALDAVPTPDTTGGAPTDATWIDCTPHLAQAAAALASYGSQLRVDGTDIVHVGGQREPITLRVGVRA